MRPWFLVLLSLALPALAQTVAAQPAPSPAPTPTTRTPLVRFDVHGSVGWVHVTRPDLATYDQWDHGVAEGAIGFGWYWTDHLKTEVEFQAFSESHFYSYERTETPLGPRYASSFYEVRPIGAAVAMTYQFRRNAWVHPFVGAGVSLLSETVREEVQPTTIWDNSAMRALVYEPGYTVGPESSFVAQPFVLAGVKAYLSPRTFFRSDFRIGFRDGPRDVSVRAGIGVDF